MEHLDEQFLELKQQQQKLEQMKIANGEVELQGKKLKFVDVLFFEEKMQMRIPESFTDMPLEIARIKYPAEQRPKIIKMNEDGSINITLGLYPEMLKKEAVQECIDTLQTVIERMNPANRFFEKQVLVEEQLTVGYFDYKSNALDSDLYNIMFVTPIAGKTMLGTFNCKMSDKDDWSILALQMMMSIKDLSS